MGICFICSVAQTASAKEKKEEESSPFNRCIPVNLLLPRSWCVFLLAVDSACLKLTYTHSTLFCLVYSELCEKIDLIYYICGSDSNTVGRPCMSLAPIVQSVFILHCGLAAKALSSSMSRWVDGCFTLTRRSSGGPNDDLRQTETFEVAFWALHYITVLEDRHH